MKFATGGNPATPHPTAADADTPEPLTAEERAEAAEQGHALLLAAATGEGRRSGIGRTLIDKAYADGYRDGRLAARAVPEPSRLREAAQEMFDHITTYDDAMGHGYCATQNGEWDTSCTCGFDEKRERWAAALSPSTERSDEGMG